MRNFWRSAPGAPCVWNSSTAKSTCFPRPALSIRKYWAFYLMFHHYFKGKECRVFLAPFDVHLKKKDIKTPDVVQPDLLVVCDLAGNVTETGRYTGTPDLVVEILSDSTRNKDMIDKLNAYMLSTVKEYWIVDPRQQAVIIYSFANHEIETLRVFEKGRSASSRAFAGLAVDVGELFADLIFQ